MLDLFEKIAIGFAGLFAFLTAGLYLKLFALFNLPVGVPSTDPAEFIGKVVQIVDPQPQTTRPGSTPPAPSPEELEIRKKLQQQVRGLGSKKIEFVNMAVPNDLYEYVAAEGNWISELQKAYSKPRNKESTRLELFNIEQGSLFERFGFEDGDVIELIDGDIWEFTESQTFSYRQRARELLNKLRAGEQISVTISRKGRPTHVKFGLGGLQSDG